MAEPRHETPTLPWPAIILLSGLIAGGFFGLQKPLKSSRPQVPKEFELPKGGEEIVQARLWQDPFASAYRHDRKHSQHPADAGVETDDAPAGHSLEAMKSSLARRDEPVLILPVMVRGAPYVEDIERRLRSRYAVLSALNVAGYRPADEMHIGFFKFQWLEASHTPETIVPFEWFERDPTRLRHNKPIEPGRPESESILVLWLGDETFHKQPLTRLQWVLEQLGVTRQTEGASAFQDRFQVKLLGPASSTSLKAMIAEVSWHGTFRAYANYLQSQARPRQEVASQIQILESAAQTMASEADLQGLEIYSPWATAPPQLLLSDLGLSPGRQSWWQSENPLLPGILRQTLADSLWQQVWENLTIESALRSRFGVEFIRAVHTDDQLAATLVEELNRRGVDIASGQDHIVIVSEWDTFYGRAMPITFAAMAGREKAATLTGSELGIGNPFDTQTNQPSWIHTYSYLRGIDGMVPGESSETKPKPEESTSRPRAGSTPALTDSANLERPAGQSQFDYMHRLAERITRLNQTVDGRIQAIGVLGTDLYDKLLVLQALHERFPGVLFFTTDLDARLLHPAELNWSRNLIVASSYGLALQDRYQRDIPPFRNTYQTSLYSSCLMALGIVPTGAVARDSPRIFEIGRSEAYNLTPEAAHMTLTQAAGWPALILFFVAVPTLLTLWLIVRAVYRPEWLPPQTQPGRKLRWGLAILLTAGTWFLADWQINGYSAEPNSQSTSIHPPRTDGIGMWGGLLGFSQWAVAGILLAWTARMMIVRPRPIPVSPDPERPWWRRGLTNLGLTVNPRLSEVRSGPHLGGWEPWVIAIGGSGAMLTGWIILGYEGGQGEPWSLLQGISIWPSEALRLLVIFLALGFLTKAKIDLEHTDRELSTEFCLPYDPEEFPRLPKQESGEQNTMYLWRNNRQQRSLINQPWRFMPLVGVYLLAATALMVMFGFPARPSRGVISPAVDFLILYLSLIALLTLVVFVVKTTRVCEEFIHYLAAKQTRWPEAVRTQYLEKTKDRTEVAPSQTNSRSQPAPADDWLDSWLSIHFIARHTEVVSALIIYPFVVLFVMILARHHFFDDWDFPIPLLVITVLTVAIPLFCAIQLRRAAERARRQTVLRLKDRLLQVMNESSYATGSNRADQRADTLRHVIDEIQGLRRGAFAPYSRHPILVAVLFPFGGMGTVVFIEHFITSIM